MRGEVEGGSWLRRKRGTGDSQLQTRQSRETRGGVPVVRPGGAYLEQRDREQRACGV